MSKLLIVLVVMGLGAMLWAGVLEVNLHSDRIGSVPGTFVEKVLSRSLYEQARSLAVTGKRKAELFFAENDDQKMEVILGFVEKDSERLKRMMEVGRTASEVKPQAELLVDSLRQARVQSWELSEGELADLSDQVRNVMNAALAVFHAIDTYYEGEAAEELAVVTSALDEELDTVIAQEEAEGSVAGTEDDKGESTQSTSVESPIPLKF